MEAEAFVTTLVVPSTQQRATHVAFPSTKPRFLLPVGGPGPSDLKWFLSARAYWMLRARAFVQGGLSGGGHRWFEESPVLEELRVRGSGRDARAVVSLGTPGPYNKATVMLVSEAGHALAVAKFGQSRASVTLLENETAWLARLGESFSSAGNVPRLMFAGPLGGGFALVQTILGGAIPDVRADGLVLSFLAKLQTVGHSPPGFVQSEMRRAMGERLDTLAAKLPLTWTSRGQAALTTLDEGLRCVALPTVVAHRDYSAWNMRLKGDSLGVFDWEYCASGYIPTYDWYHYKLLPLAQRRPPSTAEVAALVRGAAGLGATLGPQKVASADYQMLAYLVDVCLFYLESNEGRDEHDVIVQRYAALIDQFETWRLT